MRGTREWYAEVDSTQDRALQLAREGAEEGTRVVARRQGRGRGRLEHRWESPEGGLYLSVVLAAPDEHASLLPLALGAYVAEALGRRYRIPLSLKWPNDIVVVNGRAPSRKLSGILVDRVRSPKLGAAAVAGIGVNVTTHRAELSAAVRERVAVLSELSRVPCDLEEVERIVVEAALTAASSVRTATGLKEVRRLCRQRLWGVGRRAEVDGRPVGTIVALGDEGELWVEDQGKRMAIRAGDLRVDETP